MKLTKIALVSSLALVGVSLLFSFSIKKKRLTNFDDSKSRYVEIKIVDEGDQHAKYDVYALSPKDDPVLLLEKSTTSNKYLTLKIPDNANYFMINRVEKGKSHRELFRIDPLRTEVYFSKNRIDID